MVNQTGHTSDGDVVQPAGNYVHHDNRRYYRTSAPPGQAPDGQEGDDDQEEPGSGNGAAVATGSGLGGVAVLGLILYFIFGGSEPFPTTSDPWPADVKPEQVQAAASEWLGKCAKSESATPSNCPQSIVETSGVGSVHWALHGNPVEGADIKFKEADRLFDMYGTVVVSADYTASKEPRRVVTPMSYWAKVKLTDGKLDVQEIKEHSAIGDPAVNKQDPKLAWDLQAAKLKNEFTRCVRGASSAMPAGCPEWKPPSGAEKIKWTSTGDPLLTARAAFDPKFGIYRVTGTYGLSVRYKSALGTVKTETRNPKYEALMAPTPTGPVVLQIKDAPAV